MSMGSAVLGQSHVQSPLQALVTCTMPRELHEDIQELGEHIGSGEIVQCSGCCDSGYQCMCCAILL
jgi:hypothetical protein